MTGLHVLASTLPEPQGSPKSIEILKDRRGEGWVFGNYATEGYLTIYQPITQDASIFRQIVAKKLNVSQRCPSAQGFALLFARLQNYHSERITIPFGTFYQHILILYRIFPFRG